MLMMIIRSVNFLNEIISASVSETKTDVFIAIFVVFLLELINIYVLLM